MYPYLFCLSPYIYIYIHLFISLHIYISIYLISLHIYVSISMYPFFCVSICAQVSIHVQICKSMYLHFYITQCMYIYIYYIYVYILSMYLYWLKSYIFISIYIFLPIYILICVISWYLLFLTSTYPSTYSVTWLVQAEELEPMTPSRRKRPHFFHGERLGKTMEIWGNIGGNMDE
jgi:hypothetical protein